MAFPDLRDRRKSHAPSWTGRTFAVTSALEYFLRNPVVIGGPSHTVEIDECLLVRRKYNVGHQVGEQWVFGGCMMW